MRYDGGQGRKVTDGGRRRDTMADEGSCSLGLVRAVTDNVEERTSLPRFTFGNIGSLFSASFSGKMCHNNRGEAGTGIGEIKTDRYGSSSIELGSSTKTKEKVNDDPHVASLFIEEDEVVGIESTREELIHRLLIKESNRTVTSLVGKGGCGKTTPSKKIFDNQKVVEHFDCQAWVLVSQSYKTEDTLRRVMKQLCQTRKECAPGRIDAMDQNSLIHMPDKNGVHTRGN
ncbi:hypothetical protein RHSIM_Rhsim02G0079300 [Rhododendron simsii]|uniref:NB-ARC domain-containing protein n=1 Tax=Rhododendron simsii TaxID=118357 RepID=A0A834HB19_RHOSS|nr:hypothetical protein RHSIM_Rhsim02G0079300 [Rhododendron simsii]